MKNVFGRITTFRPKDWKCFDHQFTADGFFGVAIYPSHEWDGKGYRNSHQLLQYPLPFGL
jgi:hypothetical protein